jgi:hypothetical protein
MEKIDEHTGLPTHVFDMPPVVIVEWWHRGVNHSSRERIRLGAKHGCSNSDQCFNLTIFAAAWIQTYDFCQNSEWHICEVEI